MNVEKACCIGCLGVIAASMLAALVFGFLIFCVIVAAFADDSDIGINRPESDRGAEKVWLCGDGGKDDPAVLKILLKGEIADRIEDFFKPATSTAPAVLRNIRRATDDESIKGLYLVIDSPGGEVTLSDVIADAIRRFKKADEDRFVLVEMGSMCCSGGYYVAASADYIIAHPTTLTGSIGVIMATLNASELAKKIGVESVNITTGGNKAMLDPLKPVDPEHVRIIRKAVESDYERFLEVVSNGRSIPVEKLRPIADGRIFAAPEAKELGLVDEIGYAEDSLERLAKMSGAEAVRVYRYKEDVSIRSFFGNSALSPEGLARALRRTVTAKETARPMYLAE